MLPIVLDLSRVRVALTGEGEGLQRRLRLVQAAGLPSPEIITGVSEASLTGVALLFVAGLDQPASTRCAEAARRVRVLVNVEDMPGLCDFHVPAQVRRGDLLLTVSTSGKSPGLSRILRERLEESFGPEWDGIVGVISAARQLWRAEGLPPDEVSRRTRALLGGFK